MPMSWNEAVATLTGPGAPFETALAEVRGQAMHVYKNAPRSLRSLFDTARARGDATFLVYEDERWTPEPKRSLRDAMSPRGREGAARPAAAGVSPPRGT